MLKTSAQKGYLYILDLSSTMKLKVCAELKSGYFGVHCEKPVIELWNGWDLMIER